MNIKCGAEFRDEQTMHCVEEYLKIYKTYPCPMLNCSGVMEVK